MDSRLHRRALRLEYGTIAWNGGEAVLTVVLGIGAGSLALIGFGTDSLIEIFASMVVVWHLKGADHPVREERALKLIALAFLALALVLFAAGVRDLLTGRKAEASVPGIVYLAVAAMVMLGLAVAKSRTARAINSSTLRAEAGVTYLDAGLAAGTMVGLLLNAWLGWWWADPAAALLVAVAAVNEGRDTWQEGTLIAARAAHPSTPPEDMGRT